MKCKGGAMSRPSKFVAVIVAALVLACAAAAAKDYVVIGKRTYMSSFPFYGC